MPRLKFDLLSKFDLDHISWRTVKNELSFIYERKIEFYSYKIVGATFPIIYNFSSRIYNKIVENVNGKCEPDLKFTHHCQHQYVHLRGNMQFCL